MHIQPKLTRGLLAILAFLSMASALASDVYLASFPEITEFFGATASEVQLTLTCFLVGYGVGQLILGPVSDRYGRRNVLLIALTVFVVASIATTLAPSIWMLLAFRFIQGLAGAGGGVIARAIAADLTKGRETVRAMSLIASFVGLGPILGPLVGALVGEFTNWRGVLGSVALLAFLMLLFTAFRVPESLPVEDRQPGGAVQTLRNFETLSRDRGFVLLLIAFATSFATMMAYIAASPFVGQVVLGMTPLQYAVGFGIGALALTLSNFVNAQVTRRVDPRRMFLLGTALLILSALTMFVLVATNTLTILAFITLAFSLVFGSGLTMSNASALAVLRAPFARGSASAILGAIQFLLGAAVTPLVGAWGEGTAVPMAVTLVVMSAVAFTGALLFVRRV